MLEVHPTLLGLKAVNVFILFQCDLRSNKTLSYLQSQEKTCPLVVNITTSFQMIFHLRQHF